LEEEEGNFDPLEPACLPPGLAVGVTKVSGTEWSGVVLQKWRVESRGARRWHYDSGRWPTAYWEGRECRHKKATPLHLRSRSVAGLVELIVITHPSLHSFSTTSQIINHQLLLPVVLGSKGMGE